MQNDALHICTLPHNPSLIDVFETTINLVKASVDSSIASNIVRIKKISQDILTAMNDKNQSYTVKSTSDAFVVLHY